MKAMLKLNSASVEQGSLGNKEIIYNITIHYEDRQVIETNLVLNGSKGNEEEILETVQKYFKGDFQFVPNF